jgi:hypothetical protein
LIALVSAVTISIGSKNFTGERGSRLDVTNSIISLDKGFSNAGLAANATGTSCSGNVTFTPTAANANTAVATGDIAYDVQTNTTSSTPANKCFTVTLAVTSNTGIRATYGPLYIATGASPSAGQTIDCKFDLLTTTLPASPFSFQVTIQ